jgi:peptidoglycan hydrolase-like protein with peptidoglycan-binding domain
MKIKYFSIITLAFTLISLPLLANAETIYRQLQLGMSGSDVGSLQTFLAQDRTIYPQGLVTSYFGSLTKSAVSNFQSRNGIDTVGRVGPVTMIAINAQMNGSSASNDNTRVINSVGVNVSSNQATIAWNTSEDSSASIFYNTSPISIKEATDYSPFSINSQSMLVHGDLRTNHSGILTGLVSNTTYYYVIYVKDAQGNESITLPNTFRTSN